MVDFSVLIPNLGYSSFLFDCIDSIIKQTNTSGYTVEIILCDQSDEECYLRIAQECVEKYGNKVNIYHSEIKSLYRARHFLMSKTSGKYIVFVDSDDFFINGFLDHIHLYFLKNPNVDILIKKQ